MIFRLQDEAPSDFVRSPYCNNLAQVQLPIQMEEGALDRNILPDLFLLANIEYIP